MSDHRISYSLEKPNQRSKRISNFGSYTPSDGINKNTILSNFVHGRELKKKELVKSPSVILPRTSKTLRNDNAELVDDSISDEIGSHQMRINSLKLNSKVPTQSKQPSEHIKKIDVMQLKKTSPKINVAFTSLYEIYNNDEVKKFEKNCFLKFCKDKNELTVEYDKLGEKSNVGEIFSIKNSDAAEFNYLLFKMQSSDDKKLLCFFSENSHSKNQLVSSLSECTKVENLSTAEIMDIQSYTKSYSQIKSVYFSQHKEEKSKVFENRNYDLPSKKKLKRDNEVNSSRNHFARTNRSSFYETRSSLRKLSNNNCDTAKKNYPTGQMFVYQSGKQAISVSWEDYSRLDDGEFLNDTVIEFYIRYIFDRYPENIKSMLHIFNSFFYEKLVAKNENKCTVGYDNVKRWTKLVSLFEKKYVFIPINENFHWYLALIYNPGALLRNAIDVVTVDDEDNGFENDSLEDNDIQIALLDDAKLNISSETTERTGRTSIANKERKKRYCNEGDGREKPTSQFCNDGELSLSNKQCIADTPAVFRNISDIHVIENTVGKNLFIVDNLNYSGDVTHLIPFDAESVNKNMRCSEIESSSADSMFDPESSPQRSSYFDRSKGVDIPPSDENDGVQDDLIDLTGNIENKNQRIQPNFDSEDEMGYRKGMTVKTELVGGGNFDIFNELDCDSEKKANSNCFVMVHADSDTDSSVTVERQRKSNGHGKDFEDNIVSSENVIDASEKLFKRSLTSETPEQVKRSMQYSINNSLMDSGSDIDNDFSNLEKTEEKCKSKKAKGNTALLKLQSDMDSCKIIFFDSLDHKHSKTFRNLESYLILEAEDKLKKKILLREKTAPLYAKSTQQPNFCDCGVYLLKTLEVFMTDPEKYLQLCLSKPQGKYGKKEREADWFPHSEIKQMRTDIQTLMKKQHEIFKNASIKTEKEESDIDYSAQKEVEQRRVAPEILDEDDVILID
ncbi:hypothetical protein HK099_004180 [Clydaea vesicula]|uniref:Ubiquitin-like protease family profile domain-containing protein n=1 Tax=Clydaea vesicula TaxID=447962 RepID=A0AAD5U724_9FUNG|nr:hypothetical protein HK099_004180 [Clydaea vesicula]